MLFTLHFVGSSNILNFNIRISKKLNGSLILYIWHQTKTKYFVSRLQLKTNVFYSETHKAKQNGKSIWSGENQKRPILECLAIFMNKKAAALNNIKTLWIIFRNGIMSILGLKSGYKLIYGLSPWEIPQGSGHISLYIPSLVLILIVYIPSFSLLSATNKPNKKIQSPGTCMLQGLVYG